MTLSPEAREYFIRQGKRGGQKAARNRTPAERSAAARKAVLARWEKKRAGEQRLRQDADALLAAAGKLITAAEDLKERVRSKARLHALADEVIKRHRVAVPSPADPEAPTGQLIEKPGTQNFEITAEMLKEPWKHF